MPDNQQHGDGQLQQDAHGGGTGPRVVIATFGDTGWHMGNLLYRQVRSLLKTFVAFNTNDRPHPSLEELRANGAIVHLAIPEWATQRPHPGRVDPNAHKRSFVRPDAPYLANATGAEGRQEGGLAAVEHAAAIYAQLRAAIVRLAARNQPDGQDGAGAAREVELVILLFSGRGTGSGTLPVVLGMLPALRQALAPAVTLRITVASQTPTVHGPGFDEYRRRTAALFAEVVALIEKPVEITPGRVAGGWKAPAAPPWDHFLVLGDRAGAGVQRDVTEAHRYAAAALEHRLASPTADIFGALPGRPRLTEVDPSTELPQAFSATGFAELVYEPEAAITHAALYAEDLFYEALNQPTKEEHDA